MDEIDTLVKTLRFKNNDVFANQFPLYFIASIVDVFGALKVGATVCFIPPKLLYSPQKLIDYIVEKEVTVLVWAPSLLRLVANYNVLETLDSHKIRKILFVGEPIQMPTLKKWVEACPQTMFVNIYGTTETTLGGFYHIVKTPISEFEPLPMGIPFEHTDAFILNEYGKKVKKGEIGELFIRSSTLANGYIENTQETSHKFVKNFKNCSEEERIYRTGDLVFQNAHDELVYVRRKDFQIKRHGYRIELEEIEFCVTTIRDVTECCCVYAPDLQKLILFFCGNINEIALIEDIRKLLPKYMIPDRVVKIKKLPRNPNGKINRNEMRKRVPQYLS